MNSSRYRTLWLSRSSSMRTLSVFVSLALFLGDLCHGQSNNKVKNHPAWKYLNKDCGESSSDRIIGGVEASLGQFPWIVRFGYQDDDSEEIEYKCGGAILNKKYILTAAHCVTQLEPGTKVKTVRLGEHDESTNPDCRAGVCAPPVQDRDILTFFAHQKFNNPPFSNDIAVVELKDPIRYNGYVSPICLPRKQKTDVTKVGTSLTVAGWGIMNMSTYDTASALQTLNIPVLPGKRCSNLGQAKLKISNAQICAGAEKNKDTCSGDSGGPLMKVLETDEGPLTFLFGVVSFGTELCGSGVPGVYSSVQYYLPWILDQIKHA